VSLRVLALGRLAFYLDNSSVSSQILTSAWCSKLPGRYSSNSWRVIINKMWPTFKERDADFLGFQNLVIISGSLKNSV
jgi:hypothetical protein